MSKFNSTHMLTAGAFVAAATLGILSFDSNAEATGSVFSCQGSTAKKVVSCCEEMTRNRLPFWMMKSGKNCTQITVVCRAKATYSTVAGIPIKKCYVKNIDDENPNGGGGPGDGISVTHKGGGPNTPGSAPN